MLARDVLLLDTASLYFRAFFAVPDTIRDAQGRPVNALRGLSDFIATLATAYSPGSIVACWDNDWRPQWRVARVPSYKAHRVDGPVDDAAADPTLPPSPIRRVEEWVDDPETPDDLGRQVPRIVELLRLAGIPVLGADGYEADDVIGTLAAHAPDPVVVATGDRDLFQVIDDERAVRVLYLTKGVASHAVMDAAALEARYGVSPAQYADFALLRGDGSDGLPGVPGIGEKTAALLLRSYGDLAGIAAAAADPASSLKPAQRRNVLASADYIERATPVVQVVENLPLEPAWADLRLGAGCSGPDWDEFATQANLGGSGERLAAALAPLRA